MDLQRRRRTSICLMTGAISFGTDVDLVMVGAVKNRYVAREIERTKQVLYGA